MAYLVDDISARVEPKSRAELLNLQQAESVSSYVHHLVRVEQASQKGLGLFSTGLIQEGEIVAWESAEMYQGPDDNRPGKKLMTWGQIEERWPDKRERDHFVAYSYQVGEDLFLIPLSESDLVITTYQNHSCDPNTWWADDFTLVARRTIHPGEEVTFDYSTSESLENPEMPECFCKSACCRGRLEPLDYLKPELIAAYGTHFVSYLRERQLKHYGGLLPPASIRIIDELEQTAASMEQSRLRADNENVTADEVVEDLSVLNYLHGRKS
jgi:hypothetical protein